VIVEMSNGGNMLRVELQERQTLLKWLAEVFQKIRLMNAGKQVCPDAMLFVGKNDLLVFCRIFLGGVDMLFGNIACINWWVLVRGHNLALSHKMALGEHAGFLIFLTMAKRYYHFQKSQSRNRHGK